VVALAVFLALGLGLALPFLLIGFVPALAAAAAPGAWMETFKQALAFPMYLTAIWLLWVLGKQRGVDALALALVGLVGAGAGLWWFERSAMPRPGRCARAGMAAAWRRWLPAAAAVAHRACRAECEPRSEGGHRRLLGRAAGRAARRRPHGLRQHDRRLVRDLQGQRAPRALAADTFRDALRQRTRST
jgi:hypothetical protein